MDWVTKVRIVLEGRTVRHIEREANLKANVLSAGLSRKSIPNAADGVRIAAALGVTAEWLFDDEQGEANLPFHRLSKLSEDARLAAIARSLSLPQSELDEDPGGQNGIS